jgi:uncharacterized protein YbjT (DUF2867 family)
VTDRIGPSVSVTRSAACRDSQLLERTTALIVVTTPTGHIGSALAALLSERDEPLRVISRDPSRLSPEVQKRAEAIVGSHAEPAVLDAALAGADAYFHVVPPDPQAASVSEHYLEYGRQARAAIERNGVGHVVLISTLGGGIERAGHLSAARAAEAEVGRSGAAVRAIAPGFFMENLLSQTPAIREGRVALPSEADRVLPVVATADLAALAADLLVDRSWAGVDRVPASSPDALTAAEVAGVVGEAIGRRVAYRQIPPAEYGEMLRGFGLSDGWADGIVEMAEAQNAGFYDEEVEAACGRGPTTLAEWVDRVLRPAL